MWSVVDVIGASRVNTNLALVTLYNQGNVSGNISNSSIMYSKLNQENIKIIIFHFYIVYFLFSGLLWSLCRFPDILNV